MAGLDFLGVLVGFILTLVIFSYLLKDNALYRWALAVLVGGGIGYAMGLTWQLVLRDWILGAASLSGIELVLSFTVPMILGAFLLLKGFNPTKTLGKLSVLGNISLALLLGVGAALAVSGGLLGTLIPQVIATGNALDFSHGLMGLIQGIIVIIGTVTSLQVFAVRFPKPDDEGIPDDDTPKAFKVVMQQIGRVFIAVALGVAFGGAVSSALTVLVMRLSELVTLLLAVRGG